MTTIYDKIIEQPSPTSGTKIGYSTWRMSVEILLPIGPDSIWGVAVWGTSYWSYLDWQDVTAYVRGMEWFVGADEFDGRPSSGTATITLDNEDGLFSPLDPATALLGLISIYEDATPANQLVNFYFGPGTIIRIVAHLDGATPTFETLYTGIVESWSHSTNFRGALSGQGDNYVEVSLKQTISSFARVDQNALGSPVGNNDTFSQRVQRIADSVEWPYGVVNATSTTNAIALQSTDFALNRIAELYLAADSVGGVVRSAKDGSLVIYDNYGSTGHSPQTDGPLPTYTLMATSVGDTGASTFIQVDADEIVIADDDLPILTSVTYARVGGTAQTTDDPILTQRYGLIEDQNRNDLINKSDVTTLALANSLLDKRAIPLHIDQLTINPLADSRAYPALISMDVHHLVNVRIQVSGGAYITFANARIDSMAHQVTPMDSGRLNWTCTVSFGALTSLPIYNAG